MTALSDKMLGVIAREAIDSRDNNESRYTKLVIDMSIRNKMNTVEVEKMITYMADNY